MTKLKKPVVPRGKGTATLNPDIDRSISGAARSAQRKRDMLQDYKVERGCESPTCKWEGEFSPYQLQLDHINPEEKNPRLKRQNGKAPAKGLTGLSWDDMIAEVQKCQVLCANCHAERTFSEGHHKD